MNRVAEKLIESFKLNTNFLAYKNNSEELTYGELLEKVVFFSNLLKKQGKGPVIIYGHKEKEFVISIVACILANRTYVPVDSNTPNKRFASILEQTKSDLILSNMKIVDYETYTLDELEVFSNSEEKEINNDIAYIIFTSGSSGDPKGVKITYDNLENFITWMNNIKSIKDYQHINVLNQANFSFDLSVADFYFALTKGHCLVALEKLDDVFEKMKDEEIKFVVCTPTFMKYCLLDKDFKQENYPKLEAIYFCGERLENELVKKLKEHFKEIKIINAYGPTEATSAICSVLISDKMLENKLLPVGEINNANNEIAIIDNEIVIKGRSVSCGYLNKNSENFYYEGDTPCYKTGDIGYIENNYLYCLGRKDQQIKYKGYRIETEDIEKNLKKIEGVEDAVIVIQKDELMNVISLKALVISKKYNSSEIKKILKDLLPTYMIPKSIKIVEYLPMNSNGKLDRK